MLYTKYDASGNDFVIFHTSEEKDYSKLAIQVCSKEYFDTDGLIVVVPHDTLDFKWLFYNNDGSVASMCGNGTRAVAHYTYNNNLTNKTCTFLTGAGEISCEVNNNIVQTQMTKPIHIKTEFIEEDLKCCIVDTGVPHVVIMVEDIDLFNTQQASRFRHKYDANVNYFTVKNNILYVRTFERGVEGETKACGTGMVACFIKALNMKLVNNETTVYPRSMEEITIKKINETLYFTGAVKKIQERELDI
jgi:diaminopimelate epimerase